MNEGSTLPFTRVSKSELIEVGAGLRSVYLTHLLVVKLESKN